MFRRYIPHYILIIIVLFLVQGCFILAGKLTNDKATIAIKKASPFVHRHGYGVFHTLVVLDGIKAPIDPKTMNILKLLKNKGLINFTIENRLAKIILTDKGRPYFASFEDSNKLGSGVKIAFFKEEFVAVTNIDQGGYQADVTFATKLVPAEPFDWDEVRELYPDYSQQVFHQTALLEKSNGTWRIESM